MYDRWVFTFKEEVFILGKQLNVLLKGRVLDECEVAGEHHERAVLGLVLGGSLPRLALVLLLKGPLLLKEKTEILVGKGRLSACPRAPVSGCVGMTAP